MNDPEPTQVARSPRDPRIDIMRGAALIMIYVDHIPLNSLSRLTMRQFGFADAAELFVLLAGFSAMLAFGRAFERDGPVHGSRRAIRRAIHIYLAQAGLVLATFAIVMLWRQFFVIDQPLFVPVIPEGIDGMARGLMLLSLPDYLDILPLYVVLLTAFPLVYFGMRRHPGVTVGLSGVLWLVAWADHRLNLPNALDLTGHGWGFAPLSWQFLFVIGAALAITMRRSGTLLPQIRWVAVLCWLYLIWAYALHRWADVVEDWDEIIEAGLLDKTHLAPLRLLDVLALMYLALGSRRLLAWSTAAVLKPIEACGKHSLAVYSLGSILALLGRLEFGTFGASAPMQVGVNLAGLAAMMAMALMLERRAQRRRVLAG